MRRPSGSRRSLPAIRRGPSNNNRSGRALIGLDIEPGQIVAAQVRVAGGLQIERAAGMPLPPGVIRDGEVADVETLSASLAQLFETSGLDNRVRIGIANQRIVVRMLELPPIPDPKELATAVRFQAQDEIPMPLDSVILDHHSLGVIETPNGPRQQVVLVAARRDMVERVLAAARGAGLRPEAVDLSAFAMIRALAPSGVSSHERVLYLSIGGLTNLAIAEGRVCRFTRVIGGGLDEIVADVAERCQVPLDRARALVGRSSPVKSTEGESGERPASDHDAIAQSALVDGVNRIAAEVRNSLDFHSSQGARTDVVRAVLCGPAVDIPGFSEALSEAVRLPVTVGAVAQINPDAAGGVPPSRLIVAAGLAIEEATS
ncbi:MAG TPA: pilus assembly protein PilM [Solirubrobacteraceae bacterium]|nr:pilus assembly protein PilM [Solirubrobacteraceae bacterium]